MLAQKMFTPRIIRVNIVRMTRSEVADNISSMNTQNIGDMTDLELSGFDSACSEDRIRRTWQIKGPLCG